MSVLMSTDGDDELLKAATRNNVDTKIIRPITDNELDDILSLLLLRITGFCTADATDKSTTTDEDAMLLLLRSSSEL